MSLKNKRKSKNNLRIAFVSLGCPKNMVDSEKMLANFVTEGFSLVEKSEDAQIVVINTCGFIEPAREEAFFEINSALSLKKQGKIQKVVVAGCMAQLYGEKLLEIVPDIDAVVGLSARDDISEIIKSLESGSDKLHLEGSNREIHSDKGRLLVTGGHYAYLRISEGCSRKCAFCTIPDIRGPFRSKPLEMVMEEAYELAQSGVKELILIAQDTSNYGKDLKMENGLVELLGYLEKIDGFQWIRIMYLYPANVTDALIEKIASSQKILHYIDMPIQHISNNILRAMRRTDTREKTSMVVEKIRKSIPDIVLRTTVITGFPGETQENFEELLNFIDETGFDMLGCFQYSPEAGTVAAEMDNQVSEDIKQQRFHEIMQVQQRIAFENSRKKVGQKLKVIVDQTGEEGFATGRYYGQAPDIDSVSLIENFTSNQGDIIDVEVISTDEYDLVVRQI